MCPTNTHHVYSRKKLKGIFCPKGCFTLELWLAVSSWLEAAQHDGRVRRLAPTRRLGAAIIPINTIIYPIMKVFSEYRNTQLPFKKSIGEHREEKYNLIMLSRRRARHKLTSLDKWPTGKRENDDPEVEMKP